jgi:hypothetical protein
VSGTPPSAPSERTRRYRIYKTVGIAGVIALIVTFAGWLPSPREGWINEFRDALDPHVDEWLRPELFVLAIAWIALLLAGIGFIAWAAYRGVSWVLHWHENL